MSERWAVELGTPARGAPALGADGRVYVAAGGWLRALDRRDGSRIWGIELGHPATSPLTLAPDGLLLVGTERGLLAVGTGGAVLDPSSAWPSYRHDARNTGSVR